ncbi:peptide deformylase [Paenibacillus antri]|uniref:Peptide deformylase n=1 Tax=Paenibacillus antri TaxID=2582848 RepID=A0A5R9G731_9BACL|nr:peptide deformylase [Paenibacillus antri]TLS49920.1 peptide deformylase [Paenibacillus antri]
MAIRIIVKHPDPVLREVAKPVPKVTPNIQKLLTDMAETMYDAPGVGLAAPQIGISKRVIVIDVGDDHGLIEMVNPEIVEAGGEQLGPEGCLSIPGLQGDVRRKDRLKVKGLDRNGNEIAIEADGFLSRAFQHEIDHLNGVLYIDIAERVYEPKPDEDEEDDDVV